METVTPLFGTSQRNHTAASTGTSGPRNSKIYIRTLWLSDIHLGNRSCHAEYLLQFLQNVECERLYLVGDIFDMLAMKRRMYWPKAHTEVVKQLYQMAQSGMEIIYVPGNHDMPMRHFDSGVLLNVKLHKQYVHETVLGKKLLIVHGDEFDHAVIYRTMTKIIGGGAYYLMVYLNRASHWFRKLFGLKFWSLATYIKENVGQAKKTIEKFEEAAASEARQRGLDGVVCGHIHKATLREIDGTLYCNDGDWTESCSALVEHFDGQLQLLHWPEIYALINGHEEELAAAA